MSRVPAFTRRHEWVLYAYLELPLGDHEVGRIATDPADIAIPWRQRAQIIPGTVQVGCQVCGRPAAEAAGTPCQGGDEYERLLAAKKLREGVWTAEED
jgi:hypothetical protein